MKAGSFGEIGRLGDMVVLSYVLLSFVNK